MINNWTKKFKSHSLNEYSLLIDSFDASANSLISNFENTLSDYYSRHCIFVSSGTAALFASTFYYLNECGYKDILLPDRSWVANLNVPLMLGMNIDFIDTYLNLPIADYNNFSQNSNIKFLLQIIHISGHISYPPEIVKNKIEKKIVVLEDFSQSNLNRRNKMISGCLGDISVASTGITKALSSVQGGLILCDDELTAKWMKNFVRNGVENNLVEKWGTAGLNFKPNPANASIGLFEFNIKESIIDNFDRVYNTYQKLLINNNDYFRMLKFDIENEIPLYIELMLKNKTEFFIKHLKKNNIQVKSMPPVLSSANYLPNNTNNKFYSYNSTNFYNNGVILPSGPDLTFEEIKYVSNCINDFFK